MEVMVGTVLGFLSGLGIGGGSLLILYLTVVMGMEQAAARGINLLFYLPCALAASLLRRESLKIRKILPAVIAGSIAAAVFTWVGMGVDTALLQKGFGWLLVVTGLRELLYRKK